MACMSSKSESRLQQEFTQDKMSTHVVDSVGAGLAGNLPEAETDERHLAAGSEGDGVLAHSDWNLCMNWGIDVEGDRCEESERCEAREV